MGITQFIFTNILFLSLGIILWLFVRALPRVEKQEGERTNLIERWVTSELPEKIDYAVNNFLVKFFRKLKVFTLRFDNVVGDRLKKMKGSEEQKPDFSSIISPEKPETPSEASSEETKNQA